MRQSWRQLRVAVALAATASLVATCAADPGVATVRSKPTPSEPPVTDPLFTPGTGDSTAGPDTTTANTGDPDTGAPAPDTTVASVPDGSRSDLVLRADGVGTVDFGTPEVEVISYISGILGAPTNDELGEYPTFDEESLVYVNADEDAFAFPFSRSSCHDNQFCAYFGGESREALDFVGWSQRDFELLSDPLQTADGITVGSRQSDHPGVMTVNAGGCFSSGTGEAAGIALVVTSEGEPFESVDEAGNYVLGDPEPSEIVVQSLEAGDRPFFLYADC